MRAGTFSEESESISGRTNGSTIMACLSQLYCILALFISMWNSCMGNYGSDIFVCMRGNIDDVGKVANH
mgnify:CR=1 FL=1